MPAPKTTIWSIEDHTRVKHAILKGYLQAWIPKVTQVFEREVIIDGFAGPGEYMNGEVGSPIITIDTWIERRNQTRGNEIEFIFIENDARRVAYLRQCLHQRYPTLTNYRVLEGRFDETMTDLLTQLALRKREAVPTFVFIDPFGISHTPMRIIAQLMSYKSCEVFITFMSMFVDRLIENDYVTRDTQYDDLFGTDEWRTIVANCHDPDERRRRIYGLYVKQLHSVGNAKYIRSFRMDSERSKQLYHLFFGTNHFEGLKVMKKAMLDVDPSGGFSFSDVTGWDQMTLIDEVVSLPLRQVLQEEFIAKGEVTIDVVEHYVMEHTAYYYYKDVLAEMEKGGEVKVVRSQRKQRYTFPDETTLRFLPPQPVAHTLFE